MGIVIRLSGLPAGYFARPLEHDDIEAVFTLETAGESFDDGVAEVALMDIEGDWRRPDFDPAVMSVGVFMDAVLVAYAVVFMGRAEALVHPDHRRQGIGSRLARWTWEVARADDRSRVGQTISENEHSAVALFRELGYEPGHTSWILQIARPATLPAPWLPPGYAFRAYRPGVHDRELFDLMDTAFEEWRGQDSESMGFENWVAWVLHEIDPGLVVMVEHDGRIAGMALGRDYGPEAEGWIEEVAVEKSHRGQGLGRALLEESFRRFWERGRSSVGLSTDSRTGALSLYEHAGMSVRRSYRRWTKSGL